MTKSVKLKYAPLMSLEYFWQLHIFCLLDHYMPWDKFLCSVFRVFQQFKLITLIPPPTCLRKKNNKKTMQHNTTQHNTTQHNTTQHNATQHNTTQHNTAPHHTTPHHTHHHTTPQQSTPHHNTSHHTTPHNKAQQKISCFTHKQESGIGEGK